VRLRLVAIKHIQVVGIQAKKEAGAIVIVSVPVVPLDVDVMDVMFLRPVIVVPALIAVFVALAVAMLLVMTVITVVFAVISPVMGLAMILLMMAMSATVAVIGAHDQR